MRGLATHPAARGLADDAAVLELGAETLVLTHDSLVEGVHFMSGADPADVAWKLVATNLSDLAAKGAEPLGVLLSYQLGDGDERFAEGLAQVLGTYNVPLLGGDTTTGARQRSFGMTAIGRATCVPVPSRGGARPGDALYVSGPLGAAMAGFEALRDGTGADSTAYRRPLPLLEQGRMLAPLVSAMMDISDGLLLDSWRLATASGTTLAIDGGAVPIEVPEGRRADAMRWGDDYQLLFTAPEGQAMPSWARRIGTVLERGQEPLVLDGVALKGPDGLGYQHQ